MQHLWILLSLLPAIVLVIFIVRSFDKDRAAQKALDKFLSKSFSTTDIGKHYERYVGHLYEKEGYEVEYHGALKGYEDMGRDLIVKCDKKIRIIQTKCWSKNKIVHENHIFQLFGSMSHYYRSHKNLNKWVEAVFYTSAKYSPKAEEVANVLGVDLRREKLEKYFPMIKCKISQNGEKSYHLPFESDYDQIKIVTKNGDFFAKTVKEAVARGFTRSNKIKKAA